jgi:CRP-like cAMP-binding protein
LHGVRKYDKLEALNRGESFKWQDTAAHQPLKWSQMELHQKRVILARSPLFASLSESEVSELAEKATEQEFKAGEYLVREEEETGYFYILVEGRFKAFLTSSLGKDVTLYNYFRPGEMLGPASIFRGRPSSGSIQAQVPSRALRFRDNEFIRFVLKYPQLCLEIIKILAARTSELNRRLRDVVGERVQQRIYRILYVLSQRMGLELNFTRQELSDMAGTTTETAIRVLSDLKRKGIITSSRGRIILLDKDKLRFLIQGVE